MFLSQLKWLNFLGQNDSIFSLSALREKNKSFVLKSWVTGGNKMRPNFLGQNYSIFLSVHREKKLQYTMHMTKLLI